MRSSRCNKSPNPGPWAKSSARDTPGIGKESQPGETSPPQRFNTARKDPARDRPTSSSTAPTAISAFASGTTH